MMDIFDVKTGKKDDALVNDDEIANAVLSGSHAFQNGTRVRVKNPDDADVTIPAENVAEALKSGYRIVGPKSAAVQDYVDENKGLKGSLKVGLGQLADEAAFGVPETAFEMTADPLDRAKWEALKKGHELANTIGGVTGFGANMLVGGLLYKAGAKAGGAVTAAAAEAMGARIGIAAGEEVGKRTVKNVAKDILAKAAGTATEGAIATSPIAVTEAALGDPELAAESLAWGGGIGAVLGATGGLAGELIGLGKKAAKSGYAWAEGQELTVEGLKKKAAHLLTGVPEDHIEHYIENRARINANADRTLADIKDGLDDSVSNLLGEEEGLKRIANEKKAAVDYHYDHKLAELKSDRPSIDLAHDIMADMDATKGDLGALSEKADDILDNARVQEKIVANVPRKSVLTNFTKEINALSSAEGSEKTVKFLTKVRDGIKSGAGTELGPDEFAQLLQDNIGKNRYPAKVVEEMTAASNKIFEKSTSKIKAQYVPVTFDRKAVLGNITKQVNELGEIVGPQKVKAKATLETIRNQVATEFGEKISATQMRELMRTLRKENAAAWDKHAGEFNDYLGGSLQNLSENMSNLIKDRVREYGPIMDQMSPITRSLNEMSKRFGTIDKAVNSLRGVTGEKKEIIEAVLGNFNTLRGKDFVERLQKYKTSSELLKQSKLDDLRDLLLPNLSQDAREAEDTFQKVAARNEPIRRLSQSRTQAAVENMKRKAPSIETQRAIDTLSDLTGKAKGTDDFLTQIKDRHVADSFNIERINGSRRVNLAGALGTATFGGVVGGPAGAAVGAVTGAILDNYGGKILKKIIDGETMVGPLFAEQRLKDAAKRIGAIPEILGRMADRHEKALSRVPPAGNVARLGVIHALLGIKQDDSLSESAQRHKTLEKVTDRLAELTSNPDGMARAIDGVMSTVYQSGGQTIAAIGSQRLTTALTYLDSVAPKPLRVDSPFARPVQWSPSDFQLKGFEEKIETVGEPMGVLTHLENGTLTRNHMEALQAVYPTLHEKIKKGVVDAVAKKKVGLDYTDRLKLSLLLGVPLDESMKGHRIKSYQDSFNTDLPEQVAKSGIPRNIKLNASDRSMTDMQRRERR